MKKTIFALPGLLLSIAGTVHAQDHKRSAEDQLFEPPRYSIGISYTIGLANGNMLRIDLANGYDIRMFRNMDSLLRVFLADMSVFRDSLADPLTVKKLDYVIDSAGKKELRIRQYRPAATSFLLDSAEPAILRTAQDSIRILLVTRPRESPAGRTVNGLRYDRVCFFVNRFSDLANLLNTGLNDKIEHVISHQVVKSKVYRHPFNYNMDDSVVRSTLLDQNNQLELTVGAAVENYKNFFAPSFLVNATVNLSRNPDAYHFGLSWEPLFLFSPDVQGRLQTYRNDFIVLSYQHRRTDKAKAAGDPPPGFKFDPAVSVAYLVHREAPFLPQPSFRLTLGFGKIGPFRAEPALFFNDFFKGVTPGLRLSFGAF